jgi:2-polyprenyl-3-methyl-5-hydroxy-6-metoxy-1,4-benzoquinol methylase
MNAMEEIRRLCESIPDLPPYEAALAYRDAVRLEIPFIRERVPEGKPRNRYEIYAATYHREGRRGKFTDHNFAQKLIPTLELVRSSDVESVLDAACGLGFESLLLALQGKRVTANDCCEPMVETLAARRDFYREILGDGIRMDLCLSNIMRGDPELGRYDIVYVQEAISHIHPAEEFTKLAAERYLNPGGRLVVCDSNHWNPVTRARVSRWLWRSKKTLKHYVVELTDPKTGQKFPMAEERLFSPVKVKGMMRDAGLEVERTVTNCFVLPWMVSETSKGPGVALDRALARVPGLRLVGGFYTVIGRKSLTPGTGKG